MFRKLALATALCTSVNLAAFDDIDVHGYLSQGFIKTDRYNFLTGSGDGSFEFNEFALNFSTILDDRTRVGMQLLSRDLGDQGNNEMKVDWAYADFRYKDNLGLRVGKIKSPFGLYNQTRDIDMLRNSVLLPQAVYDETWRELFGFSGADIYGNKELNKFGSLEYDFYLGTMSIDDDNPLFDVLLNRLGQRNLARLNGGTVPYYSLSNQDHGTNDYKGYRFVWNTPKEGLKFGLSYLTVSADTMNTLNLSTALPGAGAALGTAMPYGFKLDFPSAFVYSAEYTRDDWNFRFEREDVKYRISDVTFGTQGSGIVLDSEVSGYYYQVSKRLSDKLEAGIYRGTYYRDAYDKEGKALAAAGQPNYFAWQKDLALTLKYDVTESWTFKLEYHDMDGMAQVRDLGSDTPQQDWNAWFVKATYSF